MDKYHIALSFAGEDRDYVEQVANELRDNGVNVFYDKFEEASLWGKDLYVYLSDIYQNRAIYTIIFVSEAYRDKLWPNHERESAQAKAFRESKEYILPAKFDKSVEIPGLLNTTGYISLDTLTPIEFAAIAIKKLRDDGVTFSVDTKFIYSIEAKSDIDFPMPKGDKVTKIISALRSYNWYTQNPAIIKIFDIDLDTLTQDQIFVLGRNIYQCACGDERGALEILNDLRRKVTALSTDAAEHLINGMFYEVYFNSKGGFRGRNIKSKCITQLFDIQTIEKYKNCISFIRKALQPYRDDLIALPNVKPEAIKIDLKIELKDPPVITSLIFSNKEMLFETDDKEESINRMWTLSYKQFNLKKLKREISNEWHVPINQINIETKNELSSSIKFSLLEGKVIGYPSDIR